MQTNSVMQTDPDTALRPWLLIVSLLLGFLAGYLPSGLAESSRQQSTSTESFGGLGEAMPIPARPSNLLTPSDSLSPRQVVEIQMKAISVYQHDRSSIYQVFEHASPTNRAVTGPLPKFERMILQQQYRALIANTHYMIGRAVLRGNVATVLVTTVGRQGRMSAFRFLLSKQSDPNPDCWMTDGVFRLVEDWRPGDAQPGVEPKLLEEFS